MKRHLFLIGTCHCYQYGAGASWGKSRCTSPQESAFRQFVRSSVLRLNAKVIAEELNAEFVLEVGKSASVLQVLAAEIPLPHLYCDPNRSERATLGIRDENSIRNTAIIDGEPEFEVQRLLQEQFLVRETEWLRRLEGSGVWPVLFVCGTDHVPSFAALLTESAVSCEIVHANWQG